MSGNEQRRSPGDGQGASKPPVPFKFSTPAARITVSKDRNISVSCSSTRFYYFCFSLLQSVHMKFSIDHKSPVPLHIQAENLLRSMISSPEHLDGKFLPNEVELAKRLAVSNPYLCRPSSVATRGYARSGSRFSALSSGLCLLSFLYTFSFVLAGAVLTYHITRKTVFLVTTTTSQTS